MARVSYPLSGPGSFARKGGVGFARLTRIETSRTHFDLCGRRLALGCQAGCPLANLLLAHPTAAQPDPHITAMTWVWFLVASGILLFALLALSRISLPFLMVMVVGAGASVGTLLLGMHMFTFEMTGAFSQAGGGP